MKLIFGLLIALVGWETAVQCLREMDGFIWFLVGVLMLTAGAIMIGHAALEFFFRT